MGKTLAVMTTEIREVNTAKGWRAGGNSHGDYIALIHSEVAEALEAYRTRRLERFTTDTGKPDDVGSEFADILIRILDVCDINKIAVFDMDVELADVAPIDPDAVDAEELQTFGDHMAWLHRSTNRAWFVPPLAGPFTYLLRALVATANRFDIDLVDEYERKITYNRGRAYQHGGRTLSEHSHTLTTDGTRLP